MPLSVAPPVTRGVSGKQNVRLPTNSFTLARGKSFVKQKNALAPWEKKCHVVAPRGTDMAARTPQPTTGGGTNQPNAVRSNRINGSNLFRPNTDPLVASYYFGTITDTDTWAVSTSWLGPLPGVVCTSDLSTDTFSGTASLSAGALTVTFQADGTVSGTVELHRRSL